MRRIRPLVLVAAACAVVTSTACGASAGGSDGGSVDVLYAGSLVSLMQTKLGPAVKAATGHSVTGYSGGSTALATQIKGKLHAADVFISASPEVNGELRGSANGDWESWYATFATSDLVLGYNPKSKFAAELKSKPWYRVITEPGFRLGSTDPATDPKGKLARHALTDTAARQHDAALAKLADQHSTVYPEETLVGRLQSGQLDAGFFYTSEAAAAKIPTVPLTGEDLKATYTVTILNRARHEKAAEAFVAYLLGIKGRAMLEADGFTLINPPDVSGDGVPTSLRAVLPGA
jgi:molybdate/tungstate transport system substrate-binding protein